jgi:hypothetical protein
VAVAAPATLSFLFWLSQLSIRGRHPYLCLFDSRGAALCPSQSRLAAIACPFRRLNHVLRPLYHVPAWLVTLTGSLFVPAVGSGPRPFSSSAARVWPGRHGRAAMGGVVWFGVFETRASEYGAACLIDNHLVYVRNIDLVETSLWSVCIKCCLLHARLMTRRGLTRLDGLPVVHFPQHAALMTLPRSMARRQPVSCESLIVVLSGICARRDSRVAHRLSLPCRYSLFSQDATSGIAGCTRTAGATVASLSRERAASAVHEGEWMVSAPSTVFAALSEQATYAVTRLGRPAHALALAAYYSARIPCESAGRELPALSLQLLRRRHSGSTTPASRRVHAVSSTPCENDLNDDFTFLPRIIPSAARAAMHLDLGS